MIDPFLKWPGGKRWIASRHAHLFPACYGNYIEPFLGSGAVFFRVGPPFSLLADTNEELVNTYQIVKEAPEALERLLALYHSEHSITFYYSMRDSSPQSNLERAARFLYLNRTCYNGIYRVNRLGDFNVPIGTKSAVAFRDGYLAAISTCLKNADIRQSDFEETLGLALAGDFVFLDPPYTVMHNNNGFVKYNAKLFSWSDQVRLSNAVKRTGARGVQIMLTNADHSDVRDLYEGFGQHMQIARASVLSGNVQGRRSTTELVVRNYGG